MELLAEALLYFPDDECLVGNHTCIVHNLRSGAQKSSERCLTATRHKITVLFQAHAIDGAALLELLDEFNTCHVVEPVAAEEPGERDSVSTQELSHTLAVRRREASAF
eukprot:2634021-Amphidinium_carterae.1